MKLWIGILAVLLLGSTCATAQKFDFVCDVNGCSPRPYYETIVGPITGPVVAIPSDGVFITNSPQPKCPDGWSLVMASKPMCAHELKEPE